MEKIKESSYSDFRIDTDVLAYPECPISTLPLSKNGDATYVQDLNVGITNLLKHAKMTGEIEKYWLTIEKQNIKIQRGLDNEKLRTRKIELFEDFDSDKEGKEMSSTEEEVSDWDGTSSEELDESDISRELDTPGFNGLNSTPSPNKSDISPMPRDRTNSTAGLSMRSMTRRKPKLPFNPLRFLAMSLKGRYDAACEERAQIIVELAVKQKKI